MIPLKQNIETVKSVLEVTVREIRKKVKILKKK